MHWLTNMLGKTAENIRSGMEGVTHQVASLMSSESWGSVSAAEDGKSFSGVPTIPRCMPRHQGDLTLRQLQEDEVGVVVQWMWDDLDLARRVFGQRLDTPETSLQQVLTDYQRTMTRTLRHYLGIDIAGKLKGMVYFEVRRNPVYKEIQGRLGVMLSQTSLCGHGYGTAAMQLALEYLFGEVNCDCIELDTADYNVPAQLCYQRLGFKPCHHQRFYEDLPQLEDDTLAPPLYYRLKREEWLQLNSRKREECLQLNSRKQQTLRG